MPPDVLQLHINLVGMQGAYFRRLQHQLDITKLLQTGCDAVSEEQVAARREFGKFNPANGAQLKHDAARSAAHDWILRGFLRDAIESTGLFLDDALHACALMPAGAKGVVSAEEADHLFNRLPRLNHKLHLPQKLEKLEREFNVASPFNAHVQSLNKARTCVVHRLGQVTHLDVDAVGHLTLNFNRVQFVARGQESGTRQVIDRPGIVLKEASMLEMHFVEHSRSFSVGDQLALAPEELYDTIITLWRFGTAIAQSVEAYGRRVGLTFTPPSAA